MADNNTPPDPNAIAQSGQAADTASRQFESLGNATSKASDLLKDMNKVSDMASGLLNRFTTELHDVGISLGNLSTLTEAQTKQFSMLSAAILGVRDSYEGLDGSIDTRNMATFTGQLDDLVQILGKDSAAFGVAGVAGQKLAEVLAKAGRPVAEIEEA